MPLSANNPFHYIVTPPMRIIGVILILLGIIFGLLGVRSYLRDTAYGKASIAVKASVKSVEIKPMSGKAVASIRREIYYMRDGVADSTEQSFAEAFTQNDPLPTPAELQAAELYVRYVPKSRRTETAFPDRVMVSSNEEYGGYYNSALFGQMFTFVLLGLMIRYLGRSSHQL